MRIGMLLSKGADVVEFRHKPTDTDILWRRDAPIPLAAHNRPETAGGADAFFDHYYGGWQESFPSGNTTGSYNGAPLGLHGEASLLPWACRVLEDDARRVSVELTVTCRRLPLRLTRRVSIDDASASFEMNEEIVNLGGEPLEYAWGHHPAFGKPFLSEHCVLDLPGGEYRTAAALPNRTQRLAPDQRMAVPMIRSSDGASTIDLRQCVAENAGVGDNWQVRLEGAARVAVRNPDIGVGVGMTWDAAAFPYLWAWIDSSGLSGYPFWSKAYVLALEPFNCPIGGLTAFAGQQILPTLRPQERRTAWLRAGFCVADHPFDGTFCHSLSAGSSS